MRKRIISLVTAILLIGTFVLFALGSGSSETTEQGSGTAEGTAAADNTNLGDYKIEIKSCRLAKDYAGKSIAIITYGFTNNADEPASFMFAFEDQTYQNGVGLNKSYIAAESANYQSDNQTKEIKKGATLDVEVAYELNDTTTPIEVEVKELISFNDSVVKKTFNIAQ